MYSIQNLPFIHGEAVFQMYGAYVKFVCTFTGIEIIFSTSVGFILGAPLGSSCNIAEIPWPLLEGLEVSGRFL